MSSVAIALVPKSNSATNMSKFRPISCCNVIYKCISKMLSTRLKLIMPEIISSYQSAFVPKRLIGDNILLAKSLCRNYHLNSGEPRSAIKPDLRKAFDSINWSFLRKVLEKMGFPLIFVNWIMKCVSSCMVSVKVNGALEGYFQAKSGLRQGDPVSPYLFVISMEVLTACINRAIERADFKYHWKAASPTISHFIFANDILLFAKGEVNSVKTLLDGVNSFSRLSGLMVNQEKSACFFYNVAPAIEQQIIHLSGFNRGTFPVTYLGLPLITSKLKARDCLPLILKLCLKFESWLCRFLSFAGRLQLLKLVLFGTQSYWTTNLFLPKCILKQIQSMYIKFLWGGSHTSSAAAKVAWKDCCLPKSEGGLGLRDFCEWNQASVLFQFWRLLTSRRHSLWLSWVKSNFVHNRSIWTMKVPYNTSWCLKKIIKARQMAI